MGVCLSAQDKGQGNLPDLKLIQIIKKKIESDGFDSPIFPSSISIGLKPTKERKNKEAFYETNSSVFKSTPRVLRGNKERIIGQDQRLLVKDTSEYPLSAIGLLVFHGDGPKPIRGTAFLISPNLAMTCSHNCFHQETKKQFHSMIFYPGYNEQKNLNNKGYRVKQAYYPEEYKLEGDGQYDYAILEFEEEIGKIYGYLAIDFTQQYTGEVRIYGYPGNIKDNQNNRNLYGCDGSFNKIQGKNGRLNHYVSTSPGQSGSPILSQFNQEFYVIGIHTNQSAAIQESNQGMFLNETIRQRINKWKSRRNLVLNLGTIRAMKDQCKNKKILSLMRKINEDIKEIGALHLNKTHLGDQGMKELSHISLPYLKYLYLSENRITKLGLEAFINTNYEQLHTFDLSHNLLDQQAIINLSKINLRFLKKLNLSNNGLRRTAIFQLKHCKFPELNELNLSNNRLRDEGIMDLVEGDWLFLSSLNLASNQISHEGIQILIKGDWPFLEVLNLQSNNLGSKGAEYLAKKQWFKLKQLNLNQTSLEDDGVGFIGKAKWKQLAVLKLNQNRITDAGISKLKAPSQEKIQKLELKGNKLRNYSTVYLNENFCGLQTLELTSNRIEDEGASTLTYGAWDKLQQLMIGDNQLRANGVNALLSHSWMVLTQLELAYINDNPKEEDQWKNKIKEACYRNKEDTRITITFK